jgi:hypothetical protein
VLTLQPPILTASLLLYATLAVGRCNTELHSTTRCIHASCTLSLQTQGAHRLSACSMESSTSHGSMRLLVGSASTLCSEHIIRVDHLASRGRDLPCASSTGWVTTNSPFPRIIIRAFAIAAILTRQFQIEVWP